MFNHATAEYKCPICPAVAGLENDDTWIKQADIFYRDELVTGFISSKFIEGNEGHPLIVPNEHFENLYDLSADVGHRIMDVSRQVAVALKELRGCDGVTIGQNNEPAGDQHAYHYHLHVVPRFANDNFHVAYYATRRSDPAERISYSSALRDYLNTAIMKSRS